MAWTIFEIPREKRSELEVALRDDVVSRQSQKVRDAGVVGGPSGSTYVLIEGSPEGVKRADELLAAVGKHLPPADADPLYRKFKDEDDSASAGMGLFFTE
jgi:hypothetical protein